MVKMGVMLVLLWTITIPLADAQTHIDVGETAPPHNMLLLIIDGMGSRYVCPGSIPEAMDGGTIYPAEVPVLHSLTSAGVLICDIGVSVPKTGPAHSVIITGYSQAEEEMVEFPDATIYDVLDRAGFIRIALMHKGDSSRFRAEQDVGLFAPSNSLTEPEYDLQINDKGVPADIVNRLEYWELKLPSYLEGSKGIETYNAYSEWELDAAEDIIRFMAHSHPDIRYFFTVNIGVVDTAGHNRGVEGYLDSIAGLDSNLGHLYEAAAESNTAVALTADHGMAFKSSDAKRGGHASEEYNSTESVTVPLLIVSHNVVPEMQKAGYDQEDIAPTLLSVLDIPDRPRYASSNTIPVKDYVNLMVSSDGPVNVELSRGTDTISKVSGDSVYVFLGLEPKINYIVRISSRDVTREQTVRLEADSLVRFEVLEDEVGNTDMRKGIASVLIPVVVVSGLLVIRMIKD